MLRSRYCYCILCAVAAALAVALMAYTAPPAAAQQPKAEKPVSFIDDIAPIFKESCFGCHGAKNPKGKLDMTRYENFRRGGSHDDPINEAKPDESYLLDALTAADTSKIRMPPVDSGNALPKEKIELIKRWIKEGAKLDAAVKKDADLIKELRVRWKPPVPPATYPHGEKINSMAFFPDNKQLVVAGYHELLVFEAATGKLTKRVRTRASRQMAMAFLPDGKLIVAGGRPGEEGDLRVYNLAGGKPTKVEGDVTYLDGVNDTGVLVKVLLEADDEVQCLALSADGKKLASGGFDRIVNVWDISAGIDKAVKQEPAIENHADAVLGVAFSADGKRLFTCGRDKTAKVWDLTAKESVLTFPDHQATVWGVLSKADGKTGYSVGEDNQLRQFSTDGGNIGKQVKNAAAHTKGALKLVAVPKQPALLTCGGDSTVKAWNSESLAALKTLTGLNDYAFSVAASDDGTLVAGGSFKGEVCVWNFADGKLIKSFIASPGVAAEPKK